MSRLSTSSRVLLVDRVVAQQLLGGLEARQRRRPLAGVLLAVEEDADLRPVALLADPQHRVLERPALDVGVRRRREEVGQVDLQPRLDDARPRVPAVGERDDERARRRVGVDRRDDLRRRCSWRAGRIRRQLTRMSFPLDAHRQRRAGVRPDCELRRDVVAALVAPGARREHDGLRLRGPAARRVARAASCRSCSPAPSAGSRSSCSAA